MEKYNKIGINYNKTRKADSHLTELLYGYLQPQKGGIYLDIGCGTGNYTIALHKKKEVQFIGIEPATKMLEIAQSRCDSIDWRNGTAEQTGLEAASVDGILATLTLHHWRDLEAAFAEMYRVLKPNGRMVIFTSTPQQMRGYWLNRYFPQMLKKSMQQMPDFEVVEKYLKQSGFQNIENELYFVHTELKDLFLYAGKHEPHLYLHPNVRKGISSFAELANQVEVEKGLLDLEEDVHSGDWFAVKAEYENEEGDYLFVIAEKT